MVASNILDSNSWKLCMLPYMIKFVLNELRLATCALTATTRVLIEEAERDHRGEGDMKTEAGNKLIGLQAKECQYPT